MLEARHFTNLTYHKPLNFAFHQMRDKYSPRHFNHLDFISQFTSNIRQISGQENIVAETLSLVEEITAPITHDANAASHADDDQLRTVLVSNRALQLKKSSSPALLSSFTAIFLPAKHTHISRLPSTVKDSTPYIHSANSELKKRLRSKTIASCGHPFKKTAALGPELANPANAPKFLATPLLHLATSPSLLPASCTFTST